MTCTLTLSYDAVKSTLPSVLKQQAFIRCSCPCILLTTVPVLTSHKKAALSSPHDTKRELSAITATSSTSYLVKQRHGNSKSRIRPVVGIKALPRCTQHDTWTLCLPIGYCTCRPISFHLLSSILILHGSLREPTRAGAGGACGFESTQFETLKLCTTIWHIDVRQG